MDKESEKIKVSKAAFKEWLEKLQQESWQLELLISGFALFAIWEARSLLDIYNIYWELNQGMDSLVSKLIPQFGLFFLVAWRIFFFNLLIHVLARGLWIGAIGLRYISSEINFEYFNYAEIFDTFLKKRIGSFDDYIETLEKFSSVIFAYTFLLFFIFLSLILYTLEFVVLIQLFGSGDQVEIIVILSIFFVLMGLFTFIDFITMGGIKKIKEKNIARIYYVFYRIFSFLTLSFLYRPLLYNFWDEKYTRRLFLFSIPYIFILTFVTRISTDATPFFPIHKHGSLHKSLVGKMAFSSHFYDDERIKIYDNDKSLFKQKLPIKGISLEKMENTTNYIRFFLRSYPNDQKWLELNRGIIPFHKSGIISPFQSSSRKDSLFVKLDAQKSVALVAFFEQKNVVSRKIRKNEIKGLPEGVIKKNEKLILDNEFWNNKKDSINTFWQQQENQKLEEKYDYLKRSMLELTAITIDKNPINDSCRCKFYIHPNLGERGLLCHFPVKHFDEGEHLIHLERKRYSTRSSDSLRTLNYYVPFYIIK